MIGNLWDAITDRGNRERTRFVGFTMAAVLMAMGAVAMVACLFSQSVPLLLLGAAWVILGFGTLPIVDLNFPKYGGRW